MQLDFEHGDEEWERVLMQARNQQASSGFQEVRSAEQKPKWKRKPKGDPDVHASKLHFHRQHQPPQNKLSLFPSFDKCDSLIYFPTSMARYLNMADFAGLTRLFSHHLDKACDIRINPALPTINARTFVTFYQHMSELHPDQILCVHHTKVVGNEIRSSIYKKFTACKVIYDSIKRLRRRRRLSKRASHSIFENMNMNIGHSSGHQVGEMESRLSPEEARALDAALEADGTIIVYMRLDLVLTFEAVSKKVIGLTSLPHITSIRAAPTEEVR
jgi:hypothetical protein